MVVGAANSISPVSSALSGIQRGVHSLNEAANEVANYGTTEQKKPVVESISEMKQAEVQVAASAKTLNIANEMVGQLIDTLA